MRRVEIVSRPDGALLDRVVAALGDMHAVAGRPVLSDHLWLDLLAGGAPGFRLVLVSEPVSEPHGTDDRVLAIAQASAANDGVVMEVAAFPDAASALAIDAADTLLDSISRTGGGAVTWWVDGADDAVRSLAAAHGLTPARALHEMRRLLPHPDRSAVATRSFVPGADDAAFLEVNNRAFAGHPEQGGWTHDTLALRMREPWFDPDGFRLYEEDGRVLGFCWTKVHDDETPPTGEIYVIAVDPDGHGRGLGRALTLAGLDSLADRGITVANLYVDAANDAAVALYTRLGFEVRRTRAAFSGTLGAP